MRGTLLTLHAGDNACTVTLPAPLAWVPSGGEVRWITRNAPQQARSLLAARSGMPAQPIYGPAEEIPALWYLEEPRTMVMREAVAGKPPVIRRAEMRKVSLAVLAGGGQPSADNLNLASLFPPLRLALDPDLPLDPENMEVELPANASETSAAFTSLNQRRATELDMWPGQYAVVDHDIPAHIVALAAIPARGAAEISVHASAGARLPSDLPLVSIHPRIPAVTPVPTPASPMLCVTTDIRAGNPRTHYGQYLSGSLAGQPTPATLEVPGSAHHLTLCWPGVGVMHDVPLPAEPQAPFDLPAWQAGLTVRGVLRKADGTPLAKTRSSWAQHPAIMPTRWRW